MSEVKKLEEPLAIAGLAIMGASVAMLWDWPEWLISWALFGGGFGLACAGYRASGFSRVDMEPQAERPWPKADTSNDGVNALVAEIAREFRRQSSLGGLRRMDYGPDAATIRVDLEGRLDLQDLARAILKHQGRQ